MKVLLCFLIFGCALQAAASKRPHVTHLRSPHTLAWVEALKTLSPQDLAKIISDPASDTREVRSWIFALVRVEKEKRDMSWLLALQMKSALSEERRGWLRFLTSRWMEPRHLSAVHSLYVKTGNLKDLEPVSACPGAPALELLLKEYRKRESRTGAEELQVIESWMQAVMTKKCQKVLLRQLDDPDWRESRVLKRLCRVYWQARNPLSKARAWSANEWKVRLTKVSDELMGMSRSEERKFQKALAADKPELKPKQPKFQVKRAQPVLLSYAEMRKSAIAWGFPEEKVDLHREQLMDLFSPDQRRRARSLLKLRDSADKSWVGLFTHFLDDKSVRVQEAALDNLTILIEEQKGTKAELIQRRDVVLKLRKMLASSSSRVKISAIQLLTLVKDHQGYRDIIKLSKDTNEGVLRSVMDAVAQKEMRFATEEVRAWLRDERWEVRARAARIYFEIKPKRKREIEILVEALTSEKDPFVRNEIQGALGKIPKKKKDLKKYYQKILNEALKKGNTKNLLYPRIKNAGNARELMSLQGHVLEHDEALSRGLFLKKAREFKQKVKGKIVHHALRSGDSVLLREGALTFIMSDDEAPQFFQNWLGLRGKDILAEHVLLVSKKRFGIREKRKLFYTSYFSTGTGRIAELAELAALIDWNKGVRSFDELLIAEVNVQIAKCRAENCWDLLRLSSLLKNKVDERWKSYAAMTKSDEEIAAFKVWLNYLVKSKKREVIKAHLDEMIAGKLPFELPDDHEKIVEGMSDKDKLEIYRKSPMKIKAQLFEKLYPSLSGKEIRHMIMNVHELEEKPRIDYQFVKKVTPKIKAYSASDIRAFFLGVERIRPYFSNYMFNDLARDLNAEVMKELREDYFAKIDKAKKWHFFLVTNSLGPNEWERVRTLLDKSPQDWLESSSMRLNRYQAQVTNWLRPKLGKPGSGLVLKSLKKNGFNFTSQILDEILAVMAKLGQVDQVNYLSAIYSSQKRSSRVLGHMLRLIKTSGYESGIIEVFADDYTFGEQPVLEGIIAKQTKELHREIAKRMSKVKEWRQENVVKKILPTLTRSEKETLRQSLSDSDAIEKVDKALKSVEL